MKTIDAMLEESGQTIEGLAAESGLPVDRLRAIAEGRWLPSPEERQKIATALRVGVDRVSWGHTMSPRVVRYHRFGLKEDIRKQSES